MRLPRKPTQIDNSVTNKEKKHWTGTNYNVLVLDQRFRQNSSVYLLILMLPAMVVLEMLMYPL
jgi:hypothetical protein